MFKRFLADYPPEDLEAYMAQTDDAYDTYPYVIISVIRDYEDSVMEEEFHTAFERYINFFEISVQYCSSLILSLVKYNKVPFSNTMQEVTTKMVSKPLAIGDWINDIFLVLVKEASNVIPDEPLIIHLNNVLLEPKGNILQGWPARKGEEFKGIAYFRNSVAHDTHLDNEVYADILKLIEVRLFKMLEAMAPLADITTLTVDKVLDSDSSPGVYAVISLKSSELKRAIKVQSDEVLEVDKYYLIHRKIRNFDHFKANELAGITPFVIFQPVVEDSDGEKTAFLFQTVQAQKLNRMVFVSPHAKARRRETELFKDMFVSFLKEVLEKINIG